MATCTRGLYHAETVESLYMREFPRMMRLHGNTFNWEAIHLIGQTPPDCWNETIDRLDRTPFNWNYALLVEDDIILPPNGLGAMFDRLFTYRERNPMTVGVTWQTYVFRQTEPGRAPQMLPAIDWKDEELGTVKRTGWYCALLDRRAFQIFGRPMFPSNFDPTNPLFFEMGQDTHMFNTLAENNWDVVCMPEEIMPHLYVEEFKYKPVRRQGWVGVHIRKDYATGKLPTIPCV